jgi:phosphoglycerol transferase MdoB-like AlkP superfamily enzyme
MERLKVFSKQAIADYFRQFFSLLCILIVLRIIEIIIISTVHGAKSPFYFAETRGLFYDLLYSFILTLLLFPIFILFRTFIQKAALLIIRILLTLILTVYIILIVYFSISVVPLDEVILSYSWDDIINVATATTNVYLIMFIPPLLLFLCYLILLKLPSLIRISSKALIIFGILSVCSILCLSFALPESKSFNSTFEFYSANNKLVYFISKLYKGREKEFHEKEFKTVDCKKIIAEYQCFRPELKFTSVEYPFLHENNYPDKIGPLFETSKEKPNIVIVIVESLAGRVCGPNADLGSFTPFLDSLITKSLFWGNFLSTSERTVNALPSSLASLPYGKEGFMALADKMPRFESLIDVMKNSGYQVNFFYGGDARFDNMKFFLEKQKVDNISEGTFKDKETPISWGKTDGALFHQSFNELDSVGKSPRLDIYLTLSMHGPFELTNKEYYENQVESYYEKYKISREKRKDYNKVKDYLASVVYTDDMLRNFFNEYRKRAEFGNTIFLIYGDHAHSNISIDDRISKYHIPLIIYSPLLKESRSFKAVSTQLDIVPSLLAFLQSRYNFAVPAEVHWLGSGLDTARNFRNIHKIAFMNIGREIADYLDGEYYLSDNLLFKIEDGIRLKRVKNDSLLRRLQKEKGDFVFVNRYACYYNKLKPE